MMTARKRVGPLPTHRLAVRHSTDYSSSDHFSSGDSLRDSSSSSSSETSSNSSRDALSDSASIRSSSDHSLPTPSLGMRPSHHLCAAISERPSHDSFYASPYCKRSRSPAAYVSLSSPTLGALSYVRADILPSPKRIRSPETATNLEGCLEDSFEPYVPREAGLGVDFEDESSELSRSRGTDLEMDVEVVRSDGIDIDPETQAEIDECIAYADALRARGINARVIVKAVTYETLGDLVQRTMPNTRSGVSRTREVINEQIDRQMVGALRARTTSRNLEPLMRYGGGQEEVNGNEGMENWLGRKCFNGTEGVVGLTRWFEKMETVFHISNCPEKYQVKYASCTLLNSKLTWWNSRKRTIGIEAAYAMSWAKLIKMVPNEEDKVERFIGGLPDNIQRNVIAAEPTKLQDAIRVANNLMDQKLMGYARSA
ncbi:hypothetical protein Tco_0110680 [Tanacetum coccineum]